jgi:hypothetical protein
MTLQQAALTQVAKLGEVGKAALNLQYPNEFELYVIALELTDQNFNTLKYFVFPIMPNGLDENIEQLVSVKKTMAGVSVLSSPTFNPTTISLNGSFGRSFKIVLGSDAQELLHSFTTSTGAVTGKSILAGAANFFDNRIKTGYGCIKILQDIIEQSQQVDEKGIRHLILYNPALGNNYLVKAVNLRFNQSLDSNMIWNYNLQLKSIAPLEAIKTKQELDDARFRLNSTSYAQKQSQRLVNGLSRVLGYGITAISNAITDNNVHPVKRKQDQVHKKMFKRWKLH